MSPEANEADFLLELKAIEAESIGWLPLDRGAYLHITVEPVPGSRLVTLSF